MLLQVINPSKLKRLQLYVKLTQELDKEAHPSPQVSLQGTLPPPPHGRLEKQPSTVPWGGKEQNSETPTACCHGYESCWEVFHLNELHFTPHLVLYSMRKESGSLILISN